MQSAFVELLLLHREPIHMLFSLPACAKSLLDRACPLVAVDNLGEVVCWSYIKTYIVSTSSGGKKKKQQTQTTKKQERET